MFDSIVQSKYTEQSVHQCVTSYIHSTVQYMYPHICPFLNNTLLVHVSAVQVNWCEQGWQDPLSLKFNVTKIK